MGKQVSRLAGAAVPDLAARAEARKAVAAVAKSLPKAVAMQSRTQRMALAKGHSEFVENAAFWRTFFEARGMPLKTINLLQDAGEAMDDAAGEKVAFSGGDIDETGTGDLMEKLASGAHAIEQSCTLHARNALALAGLKEWRAGPSRKDRAKLRAAFGNDAGIVEGLLEMTGAFVKIRQAMDGALN